MDLIFRTLIIKRFRRFKSVVFNFDRGPGANLIIGKNLVEKRLGANGVGKSSLGDALCFCLFAKTIGGLRGPDVRPWVRTSKPTILEHEWERGGKKHVLIRQVAPNRCTLNGKEVSQDKVDEALGMNYETFIHTVILGQGQPLFFDLTPSKKMEVLTETLQLDRWEERSSRASKEATRLEKEADAFYHQAIGKEDQYFQTRDQWKNTIKLAEDWMKTRQVNRDHAETQMKQCLKERDAAQRNYEDANLRYDSAQTELRPLEKQLRALVSTVERAKARQEVAVLEHTKVEKRLSELKAELVRVKAGKCPTCNGPFSNKPHRARLENKIADAEAELIELEQTASGKNFKKGEKKLVIRLTAAAEQFVKKSDKAKDDMDFYHPVFVEAKSKARELEKQLTDEENPYTRIVRDLKKQKAKDWDNFQKLSFQQKLAERKAKRVRFWVKGFKDLQLHLIKEVLQELEIATNTMLDQMGLVGWTIQYATEKENKKGTVKRGLSLFVQSPDNPGPVKWECWSGGEAQRLRIAGSLALSEVLLAKVGVDTSLEILDEPSKSLSIEGVKDLCEFLDLRASQLGKTIFYVDHQARESALFRSTITVTRTADKGNTVSV